MVPTHEGLYTGPAKGGGRSYREVTLRGLGLRLQQAEPKTGLLARFGGVEGVEGLLRRRRKAAAVVVNGEP